MAKSFLEQGLLLLLGVAFVACKSADPRDAAAPPEPSDHLQELALDLASAAPGTWIHTLPPVLAANGDMESALLVVLPTAGLGRQAVIAALGAVGRERARLTLQELIEADDPEAAEAALALGRLADVAAVPTLSKVVTNHERDIQLRTAAAASLLTLGATREAVPLLCAVLLAGSPHGQSLMRSQGLPDRPHYALERHIVIQAIQTRCGETFGLDPDAPWPLVLDGVERFCNALSIPVPQ